MSTKISDLTSATSLTGAEEVPIVQTGTTKKTTVGDIQKNANYSTTERRIGTWIDGKPLYRLVVENSSLNLTNGVGTLLNTTSLNIDTAVSCIVMVGVVNSQNYSWRGGYLNSNYYSGYQINNTALGIFVNEAGASTIKARAIIEYTKTTD